MAVNYSIKELRELAGFLTEVAGIPYDQMCQSFLKRRINNFNINSGFRRPQQLTDSLEKTENVEALIDEMCVPVTELFRDAGLWRNIRERLKKLALNPTIDIWIPQVSSGEELYTLLIIAEEEGLLDRLQVTVGYLTPQNKACVQSGQLRAKKMDTNLYNYKRFEGKDSLEHYFVTDASGYCLRPALLRNVKYIKGLIAGGQPSEKMDIILFRNTMLYFKKDHHPVFKAAIDKCLKPGGWVCVGVKEMLPSPFSDRFECIDMKEKIFMKYKALTD